MTEIPEEALAAAGQALADEAGLGNDCGFDAQWRRRTARFALTAALPHLRVQETPAVDRQTLALLLTDIVGTLDKGEEWYIADRILALTRLPAPHPRPVVDREALGRALGMAVATLEADDLSCLQWGRCVPCPTNGPCACSGEPMAQEALIDATLALLPTEEREGS